MSTRQPFTLSNPARRRAAIDAIEAAPDGYRVEIREPKRTDGQNERFHALCGDIAASPLCWAGKRRTAVEWKVLLVSGHAMHTKEGSEMVPGLEGEFVNVRESTALMSIARGSSLIEYATAFALMNDVRLRAPEVAR